MFVQETARRLQLGPELFVFWKPRVQLGSRLTVCTPSALVGADGPYQAVRACFTGAAPDNTQ